MAFCLLFKHLENCFVSGNKWWWKEKQEEVKKKESVESVKDDTEESSKEGKTRSQNAFQNFSAYTKFEVRLIRILRLLNLSFHSLVLSPTSLVHANVSEVRQAWWWSLLVHIRGYIDPPSAAHAFSSHLLFTYGCCLHTYGKVNTLSQI